MVTSFGKERCCREEEDKIQHLSVHTWKTIMEERDWVASTVYCMHDTGDPNLCIDYDCYHNRPDVEAGDVKVIRCKHCYKKIGSMQFDKDTNTYLCIFN